MFTFHLFLFSFRDKEKFRIRQPEMIPRVTDETLRFIAVYYIGWWLA